MNRAALVKTLELVKPAVATNNMVPIFQCFVFKDGTVSAYDDQIGIIGPVEGLDHAFALHAPTLLGLASSGSSEDILFGPGSSELSITMGKTVAKLPFQPEENFIFNPPNDDYGHSLPFTQSLADALTLALETVGTDTTQLALLGVNLVGNALYSCNGDALTRIKLKKGIKGRVLLSTPFCQAVLKLWSTLEMTKGEIRISDEWVMADFDEWSVYGRVLEIPTPIDFEAEINKCVLGPQSFQSVPGDLTDGLKRALVVSLSESAPTVLSVAKGRLRLCTETHMGQVKDELPFKHPEIEVRANAAHLVQAIKHCDKMAILESCILFDSDPVTILVSNMG